MGGGHVDFEELQGRVDARATATHPTQVLTQQGQHEKMRPQGMTARECLASDDHLDPLPIAIMLDTTGSMGHVPANLAKRDLLRMLNRLTQMASAGAQTPQICYCGVADTLDATPFQPGQFEADNRMDDWLTRIHLGGGGGSESMHEAYGLALYFLARKTKCDIWKTGRKGFAFITGDEMCPRTLSKHVIREVFGDEVKHDIDVQTLIAEVREKWYLFFLYVETGHYGRENIEPIYRSWHELLGTNVIRLDHDATGLPEVVSALIGIMRGVFKAEDVPQDLRQLGCEEPIVTAVARALQVGPGDAAKAGSEKPSARRRGPTAL